MHQGHMVRKVVTHPWPPSRTKRAIHVVNRSPTGFERGFNYQLHRGARNSSRKVKRAACVISVFDALVEVTFTVAFGRSGIQLQVKWSG